MTDHGSFDAPPLELLQAMHSSLTIRWGTTAPFQIGAISAEKVGYAQLPRVVCFVTCRGEDMMSMTPIVRQRVYAELAERGWDVNDIEFTPSVQLRAHRTKRFRDENESSQSYGKNKMGLEHRFGFDMSKRLAAATFIGFGSFARLPENPDR